MTSPPQCPPQANQRFNGNGMMDSTARAPLSGHESTHRFFPPTTESLGRAKTIERLSPRIARLCSSSYSPSLSSTAPFSSTHGNRVVTNGISDICRAIKNVYDMKDVFAFPKDAPNRDPATANTFHQQHQVSRAQVSDDNEPTQLLFLVRHGQTDMNVVGRLQGRSVDAPLNTTGRRQADELGLFLRNIPFGAVRASSLRRAHETAQRILAQNVNFVQDGQIKSSTESAPETASIGQGLSPDQVGTSETDMGSASLSDVIPVHESLMVPQEPDLDELSWGELEGQDVAQEPWKGRLAALKAHWDEGLSDRSAERGESLLEVEARSRRALEALLDQGHELNLVVSHGRTMRILLLALLGHSLTNITSIGKVPNTGLYVFDTRVGPGGTRSYRLLSPEFSEKRPLSENSHNEAVPQQP